MSSLKRDFIPYDFDFTDQRTPSEILEPLRRELAEKSGGHFQVEVSESQQDDRTILILRLKMDGSRLDLIQAQYRRDAFYPVSLKFASAALPDFLRRQKIEQTFVGAIMSAPTTRTVENPWIASGPAEFEELLKKAMNEDSVKADLVNFVHAGLSNSAN